MSVPLSPPSTTDSAAELESLRRIWLFLLILGLVSIVVGLMAISSSFIATLASVIFFGVLLMIAGVAEGIHAFMVRKWSSFALHLLAAALYLFVGFFMLEHPIVAMEALTLLLAASFLVGGALRIIFSLSVKFPSWPWVVLTGAIDLLLGILIWGRWPESSLWVIGLFVGIDLIFHGWSWVILALNVKSYSPIRSA